MATLNIRVDNIPDEMLKSIFDGQIMSKLKLENEVLKPSNNIYLDWKNLDNCCPDCQRGMKEIICNAIAFYTAKPETFSNESPNRNSL